jgi:hypothetical protein
LFGPGVDGPGLPGVPPPPPGNNDDIRVEWTGGVHETGTAVFGAQQIEPALHEDLELVLAEPADGCGDGLANTNADGKIVLIQRGNCPSVEKTLNAQNAGAAAVIVYNNNEPAIGHMVDNSGVGASITILVVSISQQDGQGLAAAVGQGTTTVSLRCGHSCDCAGGGAVRDSDGAGGQDCSSIYEGQPFCYVAPGICPDGQPSTSNPPYEWSSAACSSGGADGVRRPQFSAGWHAYSQDATEIGPAASGDAGAVCKRKVDESSLACKIKVPPPPLGSDWRGDSHANSEIGSVDPFSEPGVVCRVMQEDENTRAYSNAVDGEYLCTRDNVDTNIPNDGYECVCPDRYRLEDPPLDGYFSRAQSSSINCECFSSMEPARVQTSATTIHARRRTAYHPDRNTHGNRCVPKSDIFLADQGRDETGVTYTGRDLSRPLGRSDGACSLLERTAFSIAEVCAQPYVSGTGDDSCDHANDGKCTDVNRIEEMYGVDFGSDLPADWCTAVLGTVCPALSDSSAQCDAATDTTDCNNVEKATLPTLDGSLRTSCTVPPGSDHSDGNHLVMSSTGRSCHVCMDAALLTGKPDDCLRPGILSQEAGGSIVPVDDADWAMLYGGPVCLPLSRALRTGSMQCGSEGNLGSACSLSQLAQATQYYRYSHWHNDDYLYYADPKSVCLSSTLEDGMLHGVCQWDPTRPAGRQCSPKPELAELKVLIRQRKDECAALEGDDQQCTANPHCFWTTDLQTGYGICDWQRNDDEVHVAMIAVEHGNRDYYVEGRSASDLGFACTTDGCCPIEYASAHTNSCAGWSHSETWEDARANGAGATAAVAPPPPPCGVVLRKFPCGSQNQCTKTTTSSTTEQYNQFIEVTASNTVSATVSTTLSATLSATASATVGVPYVPFLQATASTTASTTASATASSTVSRTETTTVGASETDTTTNSVVTTINVGGGNCLCDYIYIRYTSEMDFDCNVASEIRTHEAAMPTIGDWAGSCDCLQKLRPELTQCTPTQQQDYVDRCVTNPPAPSPPPPLSAPDTLDNVDGATTTSGSASSTSESSSETFRARMPTGALLQTFSLEGALADIPVCRHLVLRSMLSH